MASSPAPYPITPYVSVGPVAFGMNASNVADALGPPDDSYRDFLKRTVETRGNVAVKYNAKGKVNEVSFLEPERVLVNEVDLFNDRDAAKKLYRMDRPVSSDGFKIYFLLGIATTGFGGKKEDRSVTAFARELEAEFRD